jgi:CheY-like chemotaxis protein
MTAPRLLLVDDAPEIALIVQRLGRRAGHAVVGQPDAESAWLYLQQERPDLIILDLNLPGVSGAQLCRRLRAAPALADLRLALFSHWDRPRDIVAGLDAGVDFVLSKDLLCQPDAWQTRLAEILPPATGRAPPLSLPWWDTIPLPALRLARQLNQALRLVAREPLGEEMVRCLLPRIASADPGWLMPDGLGLDLNGKAAGAPGTLHPLVIACAEQIWCLLGTAGSAAFREALLAGPPAEAASSL